jgi:thiamine-phosphate pyrophosphorylase
LATKPVPPRPVPRLYLATPGVDDPSSLAASLPGLLAEADVAAVLLRLKPTDQRTMISRVKALAPAIQEKGAALLLDGHIELVARAGADGAHLTGIEALEAALPTLKPDRIAGVGGLTTRHDSMMAAEAGADYVLFGEPDARGQRPSIEAIAERLQWWAELFEPPCVGFAASREEVFEFAVAGADFVLVGDLIWNDARGVAAALLDAEQAIRQGYAAMPAKPNRASAGNENPASHIDPRKHPDADGKRCGASLADASGR